MKWRKIAYIVYPLFISMLSFLLYWSLDDIKVAQAGTIRKAEVSSEKPLVVRLAQGRTTAISFAVRPEKVVPGNPQALEINFLGKDLTLRPLGAHPGNLLVYTKSNRYVILLQVGPESIYDDVVSVRIGTERGRALRMEDDSYRLEELRIVSKVTGEEGLVSVQRKQSGRTLQSQDLPEQLRCKGCIVKKVEGATEISCVRPIEKVQCRVFGAPVQIERVAR